MSNQAPYLDEGYVLHLPRHTLVALCGPSGSGKSTFAARHFPPTYIISSDQCRALVSDQVRNQAVNQEAFELVHFIARQRMKLGRPVVIDSTALAEFSRHNYLSLARDYRYHTLLLVLNVPEEICAARDAARIDPRPVGREVVALQYSQFREVFRHATHEGFDSIIVLEMEQIDRVTVLFDAMI